MSQEYLFSCYTVLPNNNETNLGIRDQEASLSASINTRLISVPCYAWKCVPTAISDSVGIPEVPASNLFQQMSSQ